VPAPILLDLGASRTIERAAALSGVGTVAWLSPEQADPDRFGPPGPPADVWGLGMVLLYATTGTNPLEARRGDDPPDEADLARACLEAVAQVPRRCRTWCAPPGHRGLRIAPRPRRPGT
jgi:serine/threonine protein kinase